MDEVFNFLDTLTASANWPLKLWYLAFSFTPPITLFCKISLWDHDLFVTCRPDEQHEAMALRWVAPNEFLVQRVNLGPYNA